MRKALIAGACLFAIAGISNAQNDVAHHDGTLEFVSRGTSGANAKTLMQRVPADQCGGASELLGVTAFVQDQNFNTAEILALELRANDPAGPATGSPNMTAGGLIGTTGNLSLQFPTPTSGVIVAVFVTLTFSTPIPVPSATSNLVPGGDLYVGVVFGPAPTWPATDGISAGVSGVNGANPGEQMNPAAVGYGGVAGAAGLGWQSDMTLLTPPTLGSANRAWFLTTSWKNATLQPFASNAAAFTGVPATLAGNGLNPNFGYAGMFPWMQRPLGPDGIGFRARWTVAKSTPTLLMISTGALATPQAVFGVKGNLCLDPSASLTFVEFKNTVLGPAGSPPAMSQVEYGPYPGSATLPTGISFYAQAVSLPQLGGKPELTSMCKITL